MLRSRGVRHLAAATVLAVAGLVLASGASGQVPVVTWAEPASAGLVPGGSAVTLIVHGRNLQLLDKAAILANGRRVNGAQATLQDGGSSSQRSVRISAANKAKVGTQAVLQISSGKGKQATNLDVAPVNIVASPPTWYEDADGDGFGNPTVTRVAAGQPTGFAAEGGDCDDADHDVRPDAEEVADGLDNDCDGQVDEGLTTTWYEDMDNDGFGNPSVTREAAEQSTGFVAQSGDCDDTNPEFRPGVDDPADDGVDWDCDGKDD